MEEGNREKSADIRLVREEESSVGAEGSPPDTHETYATGESVNPVLSNYCKYIRYKKRRRDTIKRKIYIVIHTHIYIIYIYFLFARKRTQMDASSLRTIINYCYR